MYDPVIMLSGTASYSHTTLKVAEELFWTWVTKCVAGQTPYGELVEIPTDLMMLAPDVRSYVIQQLVGALYPRSTTAYPRFGVSWDRWQGRFRWEEPAYFELPDEVEGMDLWGDFFRTEPLVGE